MSWISKFREWLRSFTLTQKAKVEDDAGLESEELADAKKLLTNAEEIMNQTDKLLESLFEGTQALQDLDKICKTHDDIRVLDEVYTRLLTKPLHDNADRWIVRQRWNQKTRASSLGLTRFSEQHVPLDESFLGPLFYGLRSVFLEGHATLIYSAKHPKAHGADFRLYIHSVDKEGERFLVGFEAGRADHPLVSWFDRDEPFKLSEEDPSLSFSTWERLTHVNAAVVEPGMVLCFRFCAESEPTELWNPTPVQVEELIECVRRTKARLGR